LDLINEFGLYERPKCVIKIKCCVFVLVLQYPDLKSKVQMFT